MSNRKQRKLRKEMRKTGDWIETPKAPLSGLVPKARKLSRQERDLAELAKQTGYKFFIV